MADTGGVNITVTPETASAVAQRLVCWDKVGGVAQQTIQYRTDGNQPYFRIPAGTCSGKPALKLTPDGDTITCPSSGTPTHVEPTAAEVAGLNANGCVELAAPTGLAVTGSPTQTSITVHWTAPTGPAPTGYRLAWRLGSSGPYTHVEIAAGVTSATVSGLTATTAYNFHVQARQGTYLSPATADVQITTAT